MSELAVQSEDAVNNQFQTDIALTRAENEQLKQTIDTLSARLTAFENGALTATPRGRLILLLENIRALMVEGNSYRDQIDGLKNDFSRLPVLDQQALSASLVALEQYADGITPYDILVRRFDDVASSAYLEKEKADG